MSQEQRKEVRLPADERKVRSIVVQEHITSVHEPELSVGARQEGMSGEHGAMELRTDAGEKQWRRRSGGGAADDVA